MCIRDRSYSEQKEQQKKLRRLYKAIELSEKNISIMEKEKNKIDSLLMLQENNSNMELVEKYTTLQAELDKENEKWIKLSEELETMESLLKI